MSAATRRIVPFCLTLCLLIAAAPAVAQDEPDIPPTADEAMDQLTTSPRHGEWKNVEFEPGEPPLRVWVAYPERADDAPVVVVIHEIFGLTDWVRAVADQVAAAGYIAIAPDLLSGHGPDGGGTDSFEGDDVRAAIRDLDPDEVNARLDAAAAYATGLPGAADRLGVMGFCWGGATSFGYAVHQGELDAAVVFYGTGPTDADATASIASPVLGLYGGDDARVTSTVEDTAAAMEANDKTFRPIVYDGAGHGFVRQQSGRDGANRTAAEQAWAETIDFLDQHLKD